MILRNTLFGAYVTEHIQLLLVVSTHSYLLPACVVEMRVVFQHPAKIAEHGGINEDDTHVALLFSMPGIEPTHVKTYVLNQQVAPTIIRALDLDPNELKAVQIEGIGPLPFLF